MKHFFILIFISLFILIFSQNTLANNNSIETIIKKYSQNIQNKISQNGPEEKIKNTLLLEKYITKYQNNPQAKKIFEQISQNILISDFSQYFENHNEKFLINQKDIKLFWLTLHNSKRQNHGLNNYTYSQNLENTAIEWSYNNYYKQSMDHKRNFNDSWYDSSKVHNWFLERGAVCPVSGRTRESESIAKYGFYCNDGECSEEFKESLEIIFDIYYAEKNLSYPENAHYLAIVSRNLKSLGVGYTLYETNEPEYYEYYLTTHYCTK